MAALRIAAWLSLLAAGCAPLPAGAPVPVAGLEVLAQACPRAPVPPEYRFAPAYGLPPATQAVVDGALAEWRRWGGQIVDYRAVDWARTRAVSDLAEQPPGALALPVIAAAGCWENDPRMFRALRAYWRPLPASDELGRRERHGDDLVDSAVALSLARPPGWTEAWSAAFISYVVSAGPAAGAFPYSRRHAEYVEAAIAGTESGAGTLRYAARPVPAFAPRPGDLVCSYRGQPPREAWRPDAPGWRLGAAHCDIVVAIERLGNAGRVFAVGGNIFQSVSISVHALDGHGRLADSRFRNWAVVLTDRANPAGL